MNLSTDREGGFFSTDGTSRRGACENVDTLQIQAEKEVQTEGDLPFPHSAAELTLLTLRDGRQCTTCQFRLDHLPHLAPGVQA